MRNTSITPQRRSIARRGNERGFALLEILVAFVILALGLGAILVGVSIAMRSDGKTEAKRATLRVAQSQWDSAGVAGVLALGLSEGRVGGRFSWRQSVTAIDVDAGVPKLQTRQAESTAPDVLKAFWVEVAVRAEDGTTSRLAGLKLASAIRP